MLPDLRDYFHEAEELTGIDWRLIAALAYQESHWDRLAVSPANVRGIMMLTEITADRMKVTDRLDARQSILAGARYLMMLKDGLPMRIKEPDRTWMALAAYNQGSGHIEDARILAQRLDFNPDSWVDLKKTLPLLSLSKYFQQSEAWLWARRRSGHTGGIGAYLLQNSAEIRTTLFVGLSG